jgi:diketogulonate reductase-like aldo/keto reductase
MKIHEKIKLTNLTQMPKIGIGTWMLKNELSTVELIKEALNLGFRHVDTAIVYQNEDSLKKAIESSTIDRDELFITSKCPAHIKSYEGTIRMFEKSLSNMGLEYFNLYLINAPWPLNQKGKDFNKENLEVWKAFEELYLNERVSAIGVSNFEIEDLENIIKHMKIVPHVNQIEVHPGKSQDQLRAYCKDKGIIIQAYSPLGHGSLLSNEKLIDLAKKYKVTPAQLSLKFVLQLDAYPLFKTSSLAHLKENSQLDFEINDSDIEELKHIKIE